MDDDGLFVRLSLKEMRSSGQQNGSVGSDGARVGEQRDISLQLLLQQPGEKHRSTKSVLSVIAHVTAPIWREGVIADKDKSSLVKKNVFIKIKK